MQTGNAPPSPCEEASATGSSWLSQPLNWAQRTTISPPLSEGPPELPSLPPGLIPGPQGNIFIVDFELLDGIDANKTDPCTLQFLAAPICLLYKNLVNKMVPIAIQVGSASSFPGLHPRHTGLREAPWVAHWNLQRRGSSACVS
ncbi:hypothetical protein QTO34_006231 [Cnephaeus nilssonii]|uniref:Lipoxygenase domain-containing protein n=1 Tax=Cnephaeus nilssonii TaxID=3371016 RepID=A0AA40HM93_CNENI|nr:hypothetical protein QTO34_006231 [Eptesicus nilssonii]